RSVWSTSSVQMLARRTPSSSKSRLFSSEVSFFRTSAAISSRRTRAVSNVWRSSGMRVSGPFYRFRGFRTVRSPALAHVRLGDAPEHTVHELGRVVATVDLRHLDGLVD